MIKRHLLSLTLVAAGGASTALAQKVGPEFQVNTYTTDIQTAPSVSADANGNFVVVWRSYGQDGSADGIFGQRFDSCGNPLGGEFQVNTYTTGYQGRPAVASDGPGSFVVVWKSRNQDGSQDGIFGQRYDSAGNPLGSEFVINSYTTGFQTSPSVASDSAGNFVVVWETSGGQDGNGRGIFGQRYDNSGNALGSEFQVNTLASRNQTDPSVALTPKGDFVVVWDTPQRDRRAHYAHGQRYDSDGHRLEDEFQISTTYFRGETRPSVSSDASGNFIVAWVGGDYNNSDIFAQRYDNAGNRLGGEFQVNAYTTNRQTSPKVASDANGSFAVIWYDSFHDGSIAGIFGQLYDRSGNVLGEEFQVNTYTKNAQFGGTVAMQGDGKFVAAWASSVQDGSFDGVFGQRFAARSSPRPSWEAPGSSPDSQER